MNVSSDEDSGNTEIIPLPAVSDSEPDSSDVINLQEESEADESKELDVDDSNGASGSRSNKEDQNAEREYDILTNSGLIFSMKTDLEPLVNVLLVNESTARCLMTHFLWNADRLVNDYFAADDLDEFFKPVGIGNPASFTDTVGEPIDEECGICLLPFTEVKAINLLCGHQFCEDCSRRYFEEKILDDGEANKIQCPHSSCKLLVDDETLLSLISEEAKHRWEILLAKSYAMTNPLVRFCQSEDCDLTVKAKVVAPTQVICKCSYESCLECGEMWHDPVKCFLLKRWIDSLKEDVESARWLRIHAKKCPKCLINIEKNGGCNHMSCRSCRHQFCWLCLQDWRLHQFRSCNQFELEEDNRSERLIHFSVRYSNHRRSLSLERGLYNTVEVRMTELERAEGLSRNEVLFLKRAVESLRQARQVLANTYVFAFYSKRNNQLSIFEDNQRDLELATESLSFFLEQEINDESIATIKQSIQEKSEYCHRRRIVLLDHIKEGYDSGYWELEELF